jgi:DnaK suppressor protein
MNSERLEHFRELLAERLDALVYEASRTVNDFTNGQETYADPTDRASVESDQSFLLRIRERERKLIMKIREALDRIEEGTYGICDECGEDISDQRLMARPVTTLCIECKTFQEEGERLRGN